MGPIQTVLPIHQDKQRQGSHYRPEKQGIVCMRRPAVGPDGHPQGTGHNSPQQTDSDAEQVLAFQGTNVHTGNS